MTVIEKGSPSFSRDVADRRGWKEGAIPFSSLVRDGESKNVRRDIHQARER